jgi:hypothetical protein
MENIKSDDDHGSVGVSNDFQFGAKMGNTVILWLYFSQ